MTQAILKHVKIRAISVVVPEKVISIDDEAQYYNYDLKRISRTKKIVGFDKRHVVEGNTTASDLSIAAAEKLFIDAGLDKSTLDAIIMVVQNPDYFSPATACIMHGKLGLEKSCLAFDINQGCSGYVYGLWVAFNLISSGSCKRILLCAGDTSSRRVNLSNRIVAPLFGDAGSATLLEWTDQTNESYFELGADGSKYEDLIVPAGGMKIPCQMGDDELFQQLPNYGNPTRLSDIYMNGASISSFTLEQIPLHIKELMKFAELEPKDIDYLILHQANKQIVKMVGYTSGFDLNKVPSEIISKYGNQTIASIPTVICDSLHGITEDSSFKLLLSGFGVGLSWASCIIDVDNLLCSKIGIFKKNKDHKTREELIKYWKIKFKDSN